MASASLLLPISGCDGGLGAGDGDSSETIIIIGAGAAGLGAAIELRGRGYSSVIVLEARDRIGGRIWTSRAWADAPMDLGASWIHRVDGNPITELARSAGLATAVTDYSNLVVFGPGGALLNGGQAARLEQLGGEISAAVARASPGDSLSSVRDEMILGRSEEDQAMIYYLFNSQIEHEFAADVDELSALAVDYGEEFGGDDVLLPTGYDNIFLRGFDGIDVRTGHIVQAISHDAGGVRVLTSQGEVRADRAIITLPLGVLKTGNIRFTPGLPDSKLAAIGTLGMGVLNKTYLRFSDAFWPRDPDLIGYVSPDRGEWAEWLNIFHYLDKPILLGFNAGSFGREIESWSDVDVVASAMEVLRKLYGSAIPEPDGYQITRWDADPYALGSYSFLASGATKSTIQDLGEPVADRLFFAGEATSVDYPSTVHGAYLSGQREARRIAQL